MRRDKEDPESLINSLTADKARELIRSGAIEPGMIPKVEACLEMLDKGVRKIHIIDGRLGIRCCWRSIPPRVSAPKSSRIAGLTGRQSDLAALGLCRRRAAAAVLKNVASCCEPRQRNLPSPPPICLPGGKQHGHCRTK